VFALRQLGKINTFESLILEVKSNVEKGNAFNE
jgi:hypothetical protein